LQVALSINLLCAYQLLRDSFEHHS
jgi:hypothetical protein